MIRVGPRRRPLDTAAVRDIAQSIERQGLLQPIGVKPSEAPDDEHAWVLVFGAHRHAAHLLLGYDTIEARILEPDLSEEEYLLIELQENSARNDLTKGQRKAYAAEVGQILAKMSADNAMANGHKNWFADLAKNTGTPFKTLQNWWHAFCETTDRSITPRQALDRDRQAFFAWLQAQREREEAEQARREAEAAAERQRQDLSDALEHLQALEHDYGRETVLTHVIRPFLRPEDYDGFMQEILPEEVAL
jgi:hypothetical protein